MSLIRNLTPDDLKEIQLMKQRGEFAVSPEQIKNLLEKGESTHAFLSVLLPPLDPSQRTLYYDLATAIGVFGLANNNNQLTLLGAKLQDILDARFPELSL